MSEEYDDVMGYDEELGVIPDTNVAGLFIRDYITLNGPSSAWQIYKAWKRHKKAQGHKGPSYQSFWQNYIWPLKKLGLLVEVGEEAPRYENSRPPKLLAIGGDTESPAWWDPKGYLYGAEPKVRAPREPAQRELENPAVARLVEEFKAAMERGRRRGRA
ncbi:MAG: hypothetical protein J7L37_04590 [Thermococcus sp.]|nr:hypothetical protein [Thermococcus sp.]